VKLRATLALLLAAMAGGARAQTMLDQEERLIEIHSLLAALPALEAPGALQPLQARFGLEVITVPVIDGTTGSKVQITASDKTRAFPRLRAGLGLPVGADWRASIGLGWVPPIEFNQVTANMVGLEAAIAWAPGPLAVGLRLHGEWADSKSPVTDPTTRDELVTRIGGADLSAGWLFQLGPVGLTPYASIGVTHVVGDFTVASDGNKLSSTNTALTLSAGVRLLALRELEVVAELVAWPGVMVHPNFTVSWVPQFGRSPPAP
jgi:opacity protein-like surface antigen